MHILTIVLTAVLAFALAGAGIPKLVNGHSTRASAEHLGITVNLNRAIGVLELAAAVGVLVGLVLPWLGVAAAIGVVLLMMGAVTTHVRAKDALAAMAPAIVYGLLAAAVLVLQIKYS